MTEAEVLQFMRASREGKLSTRDRKFMNSFGMSPEEHMADMGIDESAWNLRELQEAISSAKNPAIKELLLGEQAVIQGRIQKKKEMQKVAEPMQAPSFLDKILEFFNPGIQ